jgi:hypothetical protein
MTRTALKPADAFTPSADARNSFAGIPKFYRVAGPGRLVRLMQNGRALVGEYWFEEEAFERLRRRAAMELSQQAPGQPPFAASKQSLIGLYMKLCLRSDLAICKNWTENFDAYAILDLGATDSVVALVGEIKSQPYYSKPQRGEPDYEAKLELHRLAESGKVRLQAMGEQYAIDFSFAANKPLVNRIKGPRPF